MSEPEYLFTYGTLRRQHDHPMGEWLGTLSDDLGAAKAPGQLYQLGEYPGAVAPSGEDQWIKGDLKRLPRPNLVWPRLDLYEACVPDNDAASLFKRQQVEVQPEGDHPIVTAWIYYYNRPIGDYALIPSGDYFDL